MVRNKADIMKIATLNNGKPLLLKSKPLCCTSNVPNQLPLIRISSCNARIQYPSIAESKIQDFPCIMNRIESVKIDLIPLEHNVVGQDVNFSICIQLFACSNKKKRKK